MHGVVRDSFSKQTLSKLFQLHEHALKICSWLSVDYFRTR